MSTVKLIKLRKPHEKQSLFIQSKAKRKVIRAGRRGGKTVGIAIKAVEEFVGKRGDMSDGKRVLYGAPTIEQVDRFWFEVSRALYEPCRLGALKKNESENYIELPGTEHRIKAKTCWNANTLRGDYADLLILDEWQLMAEDTWEEVGAPMLLDNNGDAVFIYTPPSLWSSGVSKARDPRHASKMYQAALKDTTGRWEAFHFTSHDNPHISQDGLIEIVQDMSLTAYRQEILAEDDDLPKEWLIYGKLNPHNIINRFPIPNNWLVYSGHDFGGANPAALFIAIDPATGYLYLFREYLPGGGRSTAQHVEEFKQIVDGYNVLKRAGGSHQEDEIRQGYTAHGWPIQEPKISNVGAGIDKVRGLIELNKLFIFNDLYHTLEEIVTYRWKIDKDGHITDEIEDKERYHLMDCLRYIGSDFTPETVVRQHAKSANFY